MSKNKKLICSYQDTLCTTLFAFPEIHSIFFNDLRGLESILLSNLRGSDFISIPDRKAAIIHAIELSQKGDIILVAGKGHEDYQIIGTEKSHFDDMEILGLYSK